MKQYLLLFAVLLALMSSCDKQEPIPEEKPKIEFPDLPGNSTDNEGVTFEKTEDGAKATFEAKAEAAKMEFETNNDWSASVSETKASDTWISISPMSGAAGNVTLNITLEPNTSTEDRTIYIKITSGGIETIITIVQKGVEEEEPTEPEEPEAKLELSTKNKEVAAEQGSFLLNITASEAWTASGMPEWLTLDPSKGEGDASITATYEANESEEARTAIVTFTAGEKTDTLTIKQVGKDEEPEEPETKLELSTTNREVAAAQGTTSLTITTDASWTASGMPEWLTLDPSMGEGSTNITATYEANESTEARTATVTFTAGDKFETLTIRQVGKGEEPKEVILSLSFGSKSISAEENLFLITVTANEEWEANNVPEWITLSPKSGLDDAIVMVSCDANEDASPRTAAITFAAGDKQQTLIVTQEGKEEETEDTETVLTLSIGSKSVTAAQGTFALALTASEAWTASGMPEWLKLSPSEGDGNEDIVGTYEANESEDVRTATVTFTAGKLTKTLIVTQEGKEESEEPSDTDGTGEDAEGEEM